MLLTNSARRMTCECLTLINTIMKLHEIKDAIANGQRVYWVHEGYEVIRDKHQQYMIKCHMNGTAIGLTWADGTTMNGKEEDFYTLKN